MAGWQRMMFVVTLLAAGCETGEPRPGEEPLGAMDRSASRIDPATGRRVVPAGDTRRLRSTLNGYPREDTVVRDANGNVSAAGVKVTWP